jgi:predicted DNA-binding transcriptional regulator YafY
VFQEEPQDIVWKFSPAVAEAVAEYEFHPRQSLEKQQDGSTIVRFRAGGLMEMCWHLYTWGADVEVLEPAKLRALMPRALSHRAFKNE